MKRILAATLLLAAMLLVGGCGSGKGAATGELTVNMKNMKFQPDKIVVKKGTTVTFVNRDQMEHDIWQVSTKELGRIEPGFKSPVLPPGDTWSITFDKVGIFPIICVQMGHFITGMVGSVEVVN